MGRFASGPTDVFATGPVSDDGSFYIKLPGEDEMAPRLFDASPRNYAGEGCDVTVTPLLHKISAAHDFVLYTDDQPAEEILPTSTSDPTSTLVNYYYVDRDVTIEGECTSGDLARLKVNVDMRKGWNTLVFDFATLEFRNEELDASYGWVIPAFCTIEGDCS